MKTLLLSVLALGALTTTALAEPAIPTGAAAAAPAKPEGARAEEIVAAERAGAIKLSDTQLDEITAGVVDPVIPDEALGSGADQVYLPHPCPPGQYCIQ